MKRPVKTLKSHRMLPATLCSMAAAAAVGHVGGDDARAASMGFFKENAKKDGVVSLPRAACSGEGNKPRAIDTVAWHDRGTTLDGTEVDIADTGAGERAAARAVEPGQQLVIRMPSGLSYRVIRNAGCLSPVPGDIIAVEYRDKREGAGVAESDWGSWSAAGVPRGHERRRSARLPEYATNAMAGRIRQREQITAVEQGVET